MIREADQAPRAAFPGGFLFIKLESGGPLLPHNQRCVNGIEGLIFCRFNVATVKNSGPRGKKQCAAPPGSVMFVSGVCPPAKSSCIFAPANREGGAKKKWECLGLFCRGVVFARGFSGLFSLFDLVRIKKLLFCDSAHERANPLPKKALPGAGGLNEWDFYQIAQAKRGGRACGKRWGGLKKEQKWGLRQGSRKRVCHRRDERERLVALGKRKCMKKGSLLAGWGEFFGLHV